MSTLSIHEFIILSYLFEVFSKSNVLLIRSYSSTPAKSNTIGFNLKIRQQAGMKLRQREREVG